MIHDWFATQAIHAGRLGQLLRQEFISMYEKHDVFLDFHQSCRAQLPPDVAKYGATIWERTARQSG